MAEIGESIAVAVLMESSDPCDWCKQGGEEPPDIPNHLHDEEDPVSVGGVLDNIPENALKNDSSALGRAIGSRPQWNIAAPNNPSVSTTITPGAHHLIPGHASLKDVPALLKYIRKSDGLIKADIGYDVNAEENGVWLPGSYGVNPDNAATGKSKWSAYAHQAQYAGAAMRAAGAQFHDSHPAYSLNVKGTLNSIAEKLDAHRAQHPDRCPYCGKSNKADDKITPPYGLVRRLHGVSGAHKNFLVGRGMKSNRIESGYYTSRQVGAVFGVAL